MPRLVINVNQLLEVPRLSFESGREAVAALKRGNSLWPVRSGRSKRAFTFVYLNQRTVVVVNDVPYAVYVEGRTGAARDTLLRARRAILEASATPRATAAERARKVAERRAMADARRRDRAVRRERARVDRAELRRAAAEVRVRRQVQRVVRRNRLDDAAGAILLSLAIERLRREDEQREAEPATVGATGGQG